MSKKRKHNFASGGRNPNWQQTCDYPKCRWLTKSNDRSGGWCEHPENRVPPSKGWPDGFTPSVSSTGGCDLYRGDPV